MAGVLLFYLRTVFNWRFTLKHNTPLPNDFAQIWEEIDKNLFPPSHTSLRSFFLPLPFSTSPFFYLSLFLPHPFSTSPFFYLSLFLPLPFSTSPFKGSTSFCKGRIKLQVCGIFQRENEIRCSVGRIRTGWEKGKLAAMPGRQRALEIAP